MARKLLRDGQVVGIPTETVYGLAGRIDSEAAIKRIFVTKERPFFDPLIVHVSEFSQVDPLITAWPPLAFFLAAQFWPGPLTLVLPKSELVNPLITSGLETVAIRMPSHPVTQRLIKMLGAPLAAPSANKFGKTSPTNAEHVRHEFASENIFVLDGGPCEVGLESTVVRVEETHTSDHISILRPGGITMEMIQALLAEWTKPVTVEYVHSESSPGHLKNHYMPEIPLVIGPQPLTAEGLSLIRRELNMPRAEPFELVLNSHPALAARELYSQLKNLSQRQGHFIYTQHFAYQKGDQWTAIWDRLERAATYKLR